MERVTPDARPAREELGAVTDLAVTHVRASGTSESAWNEAKCRLTSQPA